MTTAQVRPIPEGYHTVTPSLVVKGADKLLDFVKRAFDAKETAVFKMPNGTIAHAETTIGDSRVMLGEASPEWPAMPGRTYMYMKDVDAVYKKALQAGAVSVRPPRDEFYGDRVAVVKDPAGNVWSIATHKADVSAEEQATRMRAQMSGQQAQSPQVTSSLKIQLTSLIVNDQSKALDFYTRVLGFVKKLDVPAGPYRWLTVVSPEDQNGTQLVLEPNGNPASQDFQSSIFKQGIPATMFFVNDIQKEYQKLTQAGVKFSMPPTKTPGSTIARFDDTVGNLIQITQLDWQG